MITVNQILSMPFFKDFDVVSAKNGLSNPINSTGYFEWETSEEDIKRNFGKDSFVITALTIARDDPDKAWHLIKQLILNKVAAIAIKDIYYNDVPEDVIQFSNKHNVPLLIFSDAFLDDILFHLRIAMLTEGNFSPHKKDISILVNDHTLSDEARLSILDSINPFFHDGSIACAYISMGDNIEEITPALVDEFANSQSQLKNIQDIDYLADSIYVFTPYARGLILIYSTDSDVKNHEAIISKLLQGYFHDPSELNVGISSLHSGKCNASAAIKEALYANTISIIQNKSEVVFNTGFIDHILCPLSSNDWIKKYYNDVYEKILQESDKSSGTLMDTLFAYVESEGNISQTAKLTYQHGNTIRYRLSKIKNILNVNDDLSLYMHAHIIVTLSQIHRLLDPILKL